MEFLSGHKRETALAILLLFVFICMSVFVVKQPFGDGPDEINRYKVVSYIEKHGAIPLGDDPEIIIDGYGASYAFQPILTYMIEGYLLHIISFLNLDFDTKLIIARYVNVFIGLIAAFYTVRLSRVLFGDDKTALLFSLAVIFLPQNIFIYTYVNTDGMGLLSVIMMVYATILGYKSDFNKESLYTLAIGIILCLMSYYNCYGYILMAFIAFIIYFVMKKDTDAMFKKGIPVALSVFLMAGWWFFRNILLYGSDIFALNARRECAQLTGNILWLENMANTYQAQGYTLKEMVFDTDYFTLVWKSFIAMFGPMSIPTHHYVYMAFKYLFFICVVSLFIPKKVSVLPEIEKKSRIILWISMMTAMVIPAVLALYYSYTWDFQPQGRYYLPCMIPFFFVLCLGMEKLITLICDLSKKILKTEKTQAFAQVLLYLILYVFFFSSLIISIYEMIKFYASTL